MSKRQGEGEHDQLGIFVFEAYLTMNYGIPSSTGNRIQKNRDVFSHTHGPDSINALEPARLLAAWQAQSMHDTGI